METVVAQSGLPSLRHMLDQFVEKYDSLISNLRVFYQRTRSQGELVLEGGTESNVLVAVSTIGPLLESAGDLFGELDNSLSSWIATHRVGDIFDPDNVSEGSGATSTSDARFHTAKSSLANHDGLDTRLADIDRHKGYVKAQEIYDWLNKMPGLQGLEPTQVTQQICPSPGVTPRQSLPQPQQQEQHNIVTERRAHILANIHDVDTEVFFLDEEAELRDAQQACPADKFISMDDFTRADLPSPYCDDRLWEKFISDASQLSVKLRVGETSTERPDCFPESQTPYPFSDCKGEKFVRLGSGYVHSIVKSNDPRTSRGGTDSAAQESWEVAVETTTHLVFDEHEAKNSDAVIHLNGCIWTLKGGRWQDSKGGSVRTDACFVCFTTHNKTLVNRLASLMRETERTKLDLHREHDRTRHGGLVAMLSHPNGVDRAKLSIGTSVSWNINERNNLFQLQYTMPSCPGCSGAWVWPLGLRRPDRDLFETGLSHSRRKHNGEAVTAWIVSRRQDDDQTQTPP